jgi:hypothetical protein
MKPLGDGFIKLIKMIIAPVIFCTVVSGIAGMQDVKKIGRVGGKALLYFEVVSTFALVIGLFVANLVKPGAGFNATAATLDTKSIEQYTTKAHAQTTTDFLMNIIPNTIVDAFAKGDILQVLLIAILFGFSLAAGRARQAGVQADRRSLARHLRHGQHRDESRPDRRLRRDGLHHRQIRHRFAAAAGQADGASTHLRPVRGGGAGRRRAPDRLLDRQFIRTSGRTADRAGHQLVGIGCRR